MRLSNTEKSANFIQVTKDASMEPDFWHQRWRNRQIHFHLPEVNSLMSDNFGALKLEKGSRVFLPLCGKTLDIHWLLEKCYRVVGVELSENAVQELFCELGVEPQISKQGGLKLYSAESIDIFAGDIFELSAEQLGTVEAVYDRAALVALPEVTRLRYIHHLLAITKAAPQLLLNIEYDQSLTPGPPFSVSGEDIDNYYAVTFTVTLLDEVDVPGGLKGLCQAKEGVRLLVPPTG